MCYNFFFLLQKKVLGARRLARSDRPNFCPHNLDGCSRPRLSFPLNTPSLTKMFRPSQPMMARLRLTTKQVNGGYYKGNRTGSMGYFDHKGNYVIDWKKVRTYVVPEGLDTFKVGSSFTFVAWVIINLLLAVNSSLLSSLNAWTRHPPHTRSKLNGTGELTR